MIQNYWVAESSSVGTVISQLSHVHTSCVCYTAYNNNINCWGTQEMLVIERGRGIHQRWTWTRGIEVLWHEYKPLDCQRCFIKNILGKLLCKSSCETVWATVLKMHVCVCVCAVVPCQEATFRKSGGSGTVGCISSHFVAACMCVRKNRTHPGEDINTLHTRYVWSVCFFCDCMKDYLTENACDDIWICTAWIIMTICGCMTSFIATIRDCGHIKRRMCEWRTDVKAFSRKLTRWWVGGRSWLLAGLEEEHGAVYESCLNHMKLHRKQDL